MDIKLSLIKFFDWIDDKIIGHRMHWLCDLIGNSSWWGEEVIVEFTEQQFLKLATEAHERNITFNDLCVEKLKQYIKENDMRSNEKDN